MTATPSKSQLLYIGNDPDLSKASAALLRSAGYKVRSTNPSHAGEALRESRYSAVILCATLSSEEADHIVEAVRYGHQDVPIVTVQVGMLGNLPHPASSVVVDALQGPHAFVGAIKSATLVRQKAS